MVHQNTIRPEFNRKVYKLYVGLANLYNCQLWKKKNYFARQGDHTVTLLSDLAGELAHCFAATLNKLLCKPHFKSTMYISRIVFSTHP